jgi:hypothetical protein
MPTEATGESDETGPLHISRQQFAGGFFRFSDVDKYLVSAMVLQAFYRRSGAHSCRIVLK